VCCRVVWPTVKGPHSWVDVWPTSVDKKLNSLLFHAIEAKKRQKIDFYPPSQILEKGSFFN
ncbi:MAG: hypothetical protein VYD86_10770, partial [Verrucomicrobiota bacterium]|nr:hypothetical protein [Verrucomicrobiota bacterium]